MYIYISLSSNRFQSHPFFHEPEAVICSHMQSYAVICSHMQSYAVICSHANIPLATQSLHLAPPSPRDAKRLDKCIAKTAESS